MAAKRADAVLAVNEEGQLSGILTDKDIAYRVVAEGLDVRHTTVAQIMTRNPISVHDRGSRNEALSIMVARRFRHLPVIAATFNEDEDELGNGRIDSASEISAATGNTTAGTNVVGLLDITKCVFERLDDLEKKVNEDANIVAAMEALERRGSVASGQAGLIKAQHGCPDLHSVLARAAGGDDESAYDAVPEVPVRASVRDAARVMKDFHQTAVLVLGNSEGEDRLGGIFTTKDIVLRVIAAGLDPAVTSVVRVMTPHPDSVNVETTILDALKKLHAGHYLHLPVTLDGRIPVGLVDVLTLTISMLEYLVAKDGTSVDVNQPAQDQGPMWNKFWNSTFAGGHGDTESDAHSDGDSRSISSASAYYQQQYQQQQFQQSPQYQPGVPLPPSATNTPRQRAGSTLISHQPQPAPFPSPTQLQSHPNSIQRDPSVIEEHSHVGGQSSHGHMDSNEFSATPPTSAVFTYKLKDANSGTVYRFTASTTALSDIVNQVRTKTGLKVGTDADEGRISYEDDEGDLVGLSSDRDLADAVAMARRLGWSRLMLHASGADGKSSPPRMTAADPAPMGGHEMVIAQTRGVAQMEQPQPGIMDVLRDAPLPVNVAISAGIVILAVYIASRLQSAFLSVRFVPG
ncbi:hypothetical protein DFJ73DRAFT_290035 [Zopfochytrium polystomum]|nr:hypothetical protein DFJ73DRAFT_290035 [Zopfochytrium polystomum]